MIYRTLSYFLSVFFLSSLILIGCKKNNNTDLPESFSDEKIEELVSKLGFETGGIEIIGDTIRVEEDIILFKSKLLKTLPRQAIITNQQVELKQPIKYHIVSPASSIGYTDNEVQAIHSAIAQFSSVSVPGYGSKTINFQYTNSVAEADLVFWHMWNVPQSNTCAQATWPTISGNELTIGESIWFNHYTTQGHNGNPPLTVSQLTFLAAHEIGHALGIRHTNWRGREPEFSGNIGAYGVPGTNNSLNNPDPISVFNAGTCGYQWFGFSTDDQKAIIAVTSSDI